MSVDAIPYLSTKASALLWESRTRNVKTYFEGEFDELSESGAVLTLPIDCDLGKLSQLSEGKTDVENALVVWDALRNLTPALACEDRIWTRLCHIEGLEYARRRWLKSKKRSDKDLADYIGRHFFARTQTMCRDDNALSRLWWTAYIAWVADPSDHAATLSLIFGKQDVRSNFVERTWMTTRPSVSRAVVRAMRRQPWTVSDEINFRETMKALNIEGAGLAFEVLDTKEADSVLDSAIERARSAVSKGGPKAKQNNSPVGA